MMARAMLVGCALLALSGCVTEVTGRQVPEANPEATPDDKPIPVMEEERLETELRKAIETEDFELAAEIRDKLRALKEEVGAES